MPKPLTLKKDQMFLTIASDNFARLHRAKSTFTGKTPNIDAERRNLQMPCGWELATVSPAFDTVIPLDNPHEATCFEEAETFSVVRGLGRKRTREDFSDIRDAISYAQENGDGRNMIYAVTDMGGHAHLFNL